MPAFLFLDAKTGAGGSTCAAYRYINGTPTQIGNTFGVSFGSTSVNDCPRNGVIQFQGDLYAMARDGIYKKDDPTTMTGGWTQDVAYTSPNTAGKFSGLFTAEAGGVQYIVACIGDVSANNWRWIKFDGTTWTQPGSSVNFGLGGTGVLDAIVYRNTLHTFFFSGVGFTCVTYDPATDSLALISTPTPNSLVISLCVFKDRLFCLANNSSTYQLWEFAAGSWSIAQTGDASGSAGGGSKWALFTDGTKMYILGTCATGGFGWRAYEIDDALTRTEITATAVIPGLRYTGAAGGAYAGGGLISGERFVAVYDVDSAPGTLGIYLYHATSGTSGVSFSVFPWTAGVMGSQIDSGGNVYHSVPSGYPNNGERIWTAGELDIKITARTALLGGEQISFIAYGGGTGRKMKLYFALDNEPILVEATLAGPVTGGSATLNTGLNQVEGVAADGTTVYTVVWDVQADSLAAGQRAMRVPQVLV